MHNKENKLRILTAGVAKDIMQELVQIWNEQHPQLPAELYSDGSVNLIRKIQSGEPCDVAVIADNTIIESMLMPRFAAGYIIFAGNKMVISAKGGKQITGENWKDVLLAPDTKFAHKNPYADPGGYRGLMALMLADQVEEGLGQKLLEHPGHIGMDPSLTLSTLPPHDFLFEYYSGAASRGAVFAELPAVMDQSDPALTQTYAKVSFAVDADSRVVCTPIAHAVTIPTAAAHPEAAKQFVRLFLETDFASRHFVQRRQTVGEDILK